MRAHDLSCMYPTGRKHCTQCGCWRPISDFHVAKRDGNRILLGSWCASCKLVKRRNGRPPRGHGRMPRELRNLRRRQQYREMTEEQRQKRRDDQLMWYYLRKERETGSMPKRRVKKKERDELKLARQRDNGVVGRLPIEPFREFLEPFYERYGLNELAAIVDVHETQLRRWLGVGNRKDESISIRLSSVETVLLQLGGELWEVYPELYR